jgi:hypothetical protein
VEESWQVLKTRLWKKKSQKEELSEQLLDQKISAKDKASKLEAFLLSIVS